MKIDGVTALAAVLIASFAIERIANGILFLLRLIPAFARFAPDPDDAPDGTARRRADRRQKLVYYLLAGSLAIFVIAWYGNVTVLSLIGFTAVPHALDVVFTGLLLTAGSDRVAALVKMPEALGAKKQAEQQQPVQINGTLVLEDRGEKHSTLRANGGA
jgi:hypothetical protein